MTLKEKARDMAKEIICVSLGFIASSLLLAIGASLVQKEIWIGIIPIVIGYELARYVTLFILKVQLPEVFKK